MDEHRDDADYAKSVVARAVIAGFVRGIGSEYHSSGTNPYFSHERFHEAHDLIIRAWTEPGFFVFDGDHFSLQYVNLWPRPYQTPHPPVWIPSQGSSDTVAWAADPKRRYPFLVTFSSADLVARYHNSYRERARQYGYDAAPDQLGWACPIYVAETGRQRVSRVVLHKEVSSPPRKRRSRDLSPHFGQPLKTPSDDAVRVRRVGWAVVCGHERLGGTTTQGSWWWLRRAQALDAALADRRARRAR